MLETQFKLIKMIKGDILTQITKNSKDLSLSLFLRLALMIFFFSTTLTIHMYWKRQLSANGILLLLCILSREINLFPFSTINVIISQTLLIYLFINIYCGHKCDMCWLSSRGSNDAGHKVSQAPII